MTEFKDIKSCSGCIKYSVCKYAVERTKLHDSLQDLCNSNVCKAKSGMFSVSLSCSEFSNNIRERGM